MAAFVINGQNEKQFPLLPSFWCSKYTLLVLPFSRIFPFHLLIVGHSHSYLHQPLFRNSIPDSSFSIVSSFFPIFRFLCSPILKTLDSSMEEEPSKQKARLSLIDVSAEDDSLFISSPPCDSRNPKTSGDPFSPLYWSWIYSLFSLQRVPIQGLEFGFPVYDAWPQLSFVKKWIRYDFAIRGIWVFFCVAYFHWISFVRL